MKSFRLLNSSLRLSSLMASAQRGSLTTDMTLDLIAHHSAKRHKSRRQPVDDATSQEMNGGLLSEAPLGSESAEAAVELG